VSADQWWSWALSAVGVAGFILAGRKIWWAWYVNIGNQALWLTYSLLTEQYGFLVATVVYTVVFAKNAATWTREHLEVGADQ
jgi:threonine/homoserine efflux transporter RhtA